MHYESIAVRGGRHDDEGPIKGVTYPIHLATAFVQDGIGDDYGEFMYTRCGNPTRDNVEKQVAQLEGASYCLATQSGMAATSLAFGLLAPGDKLLLNSNVYGGTWDYVSHLFPEKGIQYEVVTDFNSYDFDSVDDSVRMVFVETPTNPLLDVTDLKRVCSECKKRGILCVVDNTFMTSYLQRPLDFGADLVVYSGTKYYAGHSDVICGMVVFNDDTLHERLLLQRKVFGSALSVFDCFLLSRGIKTMPLRIERAQENALAITTALEKSDAFTSVHYPGLPSDPGYEIQKSQARGSGALFSAELSEDYDISAFCNALNLFDLAVSLGGVESLVCHPGSMTHEAYAPELQAQIGITKRLLRFGVGVEHQEDLLEDIRQALEKSRL